MNIGIFGSKLFPRRDWVELFVDMLPESSKVITTGMTGPSVWAEEHSKETGRKTQAFVLTKHFDSNSEFYEAATNRNRNMAKECDLAVVFWIGNDATSRNVINSMAELGVPVWIIPGELAHFKALLIMRQIQAYVKTGTAEAEAIVKA